MTVEKLTVGQEVRVFTGRRRDEDGQPGVIARVGRKWGVATYEARLHDWRGNTSVGQREIEFDLETGFERGDQFGNGYQVRTPERAEMERREHEAVMFLRENGIDILQRARLTLEQLEAIAALLSDPKPEGRDR